MHAYLKVVLGMVALAVGPLFAAESAKTGAEGPRKLLEPPKKEVASPITDRFAIRGLFLGSDISTLVRIDDSAGTPGTLFNGEDTLGFPDRKRQPNLDLMFRMGKRQRIHADFFKLTRAGDVVLNQQVRFGDAVFQAGERVVSTMELRKLGIAWTWSALQTEKFELGIGLALHLMQLEGDVQAPARFERERLDAAGPYPSLAVDGTWRMTRRFSLNVAGNWLGGTIQAVDGRYQSMHADVQFRLRPNFAVGAGYSRTQFRVDSATTDFAGYLNLKYKGPEAFLRVSF
ncbi:MAG: hypothetical protein ABI645_10920 [Pseudomonadota bacterium]